MTKRLQNRISRILNLRAQGFSFREIDTILWGADTSYRSYWVIRKNA